MSYRRMADMTKADIELWQSSDKRELRELPARILAALTSLGSLRGLLLVTRLEHSLQAASRAVRDGRGDEYVVAALLHDIGDGLAPYTHADVAVAILSPFVDERTCWIVKHHTEFLTFYYAHLTGGDRNAREKYRGHPYYDDCVQFCHEYDQNCFDPEYDSHPLDYFEPMVRRIFSEPRYLSRPKG
jgi:predicted HD phosphohydrolase